MELTETQKQILSVLENGEHSRREIVREMKIARSTVFDNLRKLKKWGKVFYTTEKRNKRGRPLTYWRLC